MKYKKISIVIPVYNEKNNIKKILNRVKEAEVFGLKKEIIIVDDFSNDGTREILKKLKDPYIKIFFHEVNKGKGSALRTGFSKATGDIIVIQDADLEYDPNDYIILLKPILSGKTKVVYGSRFMQKSIIGKERWAIPTHYIGNKLLSFATSILYFRWISDMETCYKMFTREVLKSLKLRATRFDFEPEITSKILKKGYKIVEVPINFNPRSFEEGKKITWKDGIKALWCLLKYRIVD